MGHGSKFESSRITRTSVLSLSSRRCPVFHSQYDIVEAYGKANRVEPIRAKPEAIASICYTSVSPSFSWKIMSDHRSRYRELPLIQKVLFAEFLFEMLRNVNDFTGVLLSQASLGLATQSNIYGLAVPDEACLISYLPLAHIYEVSLLSLSVIMQHGVIS